MGLRVLAVWIFHKLFITAPPARPLNYTSFVVVSDHLGVISTDIICLPLALTGSKYASWEPVLRLRW